MLSKPKTWLMMSVRPIQSSATKRHENPTHNPKAKSISWLLLEQALRFFGHLKYYL